MPLAFVAFGDDDWGTDLPIARDYSDLAGMFAKAQGGQIVCDQETGGWQAALVRPGKTPDYFGGSWPSKEAAVDAYGRWVYSLSYDDCKVLHYRHPKILTAAYLVDLIKYDKRENVRRGLHEMAKKLLMLEEDDVQEATR